MAQLNELEFPCEVKKLDDKVEFTIDLSKYKYKMHLTSTLMLVRALWESRIAYVVEYYFRIIEKDSKINKFIALQDSHKELSKHNESAYYNSNHTITSEYSKENIEQKRFFKRLKNTKYDVYSSEHTELSKLWGGGNDYFDKVGN